MAFENINLVMHMICSAHQTLNPTKKDFVMDKQPDNYALECIDLAEDMKEKAIGVMALGELMLAADPNAIDGSILRGLGHVLTAYGRVMMDDCDTGSQESRAAQPDSSPQAGKRHTFSMAGAQTYQTSTKPR